MTKNQIAQWIVERINPSKSEERILCSMCRFYELENKYGLAIFCHGECVKGIAEALRQAQKERYGKK